jgi:hypothetical protein
MPPVTRGIGVLNWGTADESWGYAENVTVDDESEKEPVKDGNGDTVGVIYTDAKQKISAEYTPLAAGGGPFDSGIEIGSELTIKTEGSETIAMVIEGRSRKYTKGKATTWSINGYYYPNLGTEETVPDPGA